MTPGRGVFEMSLPLQCEVPYESGVQRAGRPRDPAPHATALSESTSGRTGHRASRATRAPSAAAREPGPPRPCRTCTREQATSPK